MYLLSVQGRHAPAFQLGKSTAIQLKQQLGAETGKPVLVISSRFRSDLIYLDNANSLTTSLKQWCAVVKTPYSDSLKVKFFRSDEETSSLLHFIHRLHLIRRIPTWHDSYMEELQNMLLENRQHPLHQKLSEAVESYIHLVKCQIRKQEQENIRKKLSGFTDLNRLACKNMANIN